MDFIDREYKFEFYFYNDYAIGYEEYFKNRNKLPIWMEGFPDDNMTAIFVNFEKRKGLIIGVMNVLIREEKNDLFKKSGRKFLMGSPNDLVGHLLLIPSVITNS